MVAITLPCLRDRTGNKLLEHRLVEIGKLFEIETGLSHLVLTELRQQGSLLGFFRHQVDDQLSTADGEARQRGFHGSPVFMGIPVRAC